LVKLTKGYCSRLLRQEVPLLQRTLPSLWTNASFVSTTGDAPLSVVDRSIEQQKHG
jgi:putative transposase